MATQTWAFGDRVIHTQRPEWGVGVVTATQSTTHEGLPCQMLTVRFSRAGIKNISTAFATLKPATQHDDLHSDQDQPASDFSGTPLSPASKSNGSHGHNHPDPFIAKLRGEVDLKTRMLRIPDEAADPFATPLQRLNATLRLYRYLPTGGALLDWASVQSGLTDPMTRFNRHELEKFFEQWTIARDNHLKKIVQEVRKADPAGLASALKAAPPIVHQTLRRLDALR